MIHLNNKSKTKTNYHNFSPIENFNWNDNVYSINEKVTDAELYERSPIMYELLKGHKPTQDVRSINIGDVITGNVYKIDLRNIHLNAYGKFNITVPNEYDIFEELKKLRVGDDLTVKITKYLKNTTELEGSISAYRLQSVKENIDSAFNNKTPLKVRVVEITKGGYSLDYNGIKLFMPNTLANVNKVIEPEEMIDREIFVMIEQDHDSPTYVASHRSYLESQAPLAMKKLVKGGHYEGLVSGVTKFGVFVQFNESLVGMIHKDNIVEEYADKLHEIEIGTEIEFYFKEIVKDRIILTQFWRDSIWDTISIGDIYEGVITKNESFGSFVQLDPETRGLVNLNELKKLGKEPVVGETIRVRVSGIIYDSKKITFSIP